MVRRWGLRSPVDRPERTSGAICCRGRDALRQRICTTGLEGRVAPVPISRLSSLCWEVGALSHVIMLEAERVLCYQTTCLLHVEPRDNKSLEAHISTLSPAVNVYIKHMSLVIFD